jgi:hypothetical protein
LLHGIYEPKKRPATARPRINFRVAQIDYQAFLAARQGEAAKGGAHDSEDGPLSLGNETSTLAHGAEKAGVILSVGDAEKSPWPQRVAELFLESLQGSG